MAWNVCPVVIEMAQVDQTRWISFFDSIRYYSNRAYPDDGKNCKWNVNDVAKHVMLFFCELEEESREQMEFDDDDCCPTVSPCSTYSSADSGVINLLNRVKIISKATMNRFIIDPILCSIVRSNRLINSKVTSVNIVCRRSVLCLSRCVQQ